MMRKLLILPFMASYIAFILTMALLSFLAALWFFGQGNPLFGIALLIVSLFIVSKTFSFPSSAREEKVKENKREELKKE